MCYSIIYVYENTIKELELGFGFVAAFPYFAQDDSRMKAVKDSEWHRNLFKNNW